MLTLFRESLVAALLVFIILLLHLLLIILGHGFMIFKYEKCWCHRQEYVVYLAEYLLKEPSRWHV